MVWIGVDIAAAAGIQLAENAPRAFSAPQVFSREGKQRAVTLYGATAHEVESAVSDAPAYWLSGSPSPRARRIALTE